MLDAPEAGLVVVRGGALRGGAYLFGVLLSIATVPLMTRHLGVEDYGRFVTVISLMAIVGALTEGGLTNLGVRELATGDYGDRRLLCNLLGLRVLLTVVGLVAATLFTVVAGYPDVLVVGTVVVGAALLVEQVQQTCTIPLSISASAG